MRLTHLSLFSGIGGLDIAAEWAGFETVGQCEFADYPTRILEKHWPEVPRWRDVRDLTAADFTARTGLESVDCISGGFPCQDISYAKTWSTNGANTIDGIDGKRSGLWKEYKRIIYETKPKYVVAENVKALTNKGLDIVLQDLTEIGYDAEWCIVAAASFGAPHRRERCIIVAYPIGHRRNEESVIQSGFSVEAVRQAPKWELSRTVCETHRKKALPASFGVHDGVRRELYDAERIKCLGNSVVPQQFYPIFKAIAELEAECLLAK